MNKEAAFKMRTINVKKLDTEAFKVFGSFSNMMDPKTPRIGDDSMGFYRDMEILDLGQASRAAFSVAHIKKRPFVIDMVESHMNCGEAMLPLDEDILIYLGPATPNGEIPLDKLEVFYVPARTLVVLRPGVWHCGPFVVNAEYVNMLVVLPERTYARDCFLYEIPEEERIMIEMR
jgi:ureidoglycolate lyase